jgi:hypothetical protein
MNLWPIAGTKQKGYFAMGSKYLPVSWLIL